jgi:maleate cis-trans isomerase
MLPEGIGVLPLFLNIREGSTAEFKRAVAPYEPLVRQLAEAGCDLIHPEGAPPFMMLGFKGEAAQIRAWEETYRLPVFTSGSNHVRALHALKARRVLGVTYFTGAINDVFANYFREAGFDVLGMAGMEVAFDKVGELAAEQVYAYVKRAFRQHRKVDAIYLLGTGWRVLPILDLLERDLGVPVVHPVPARCWEIQLRLTVRQPVQGFGRLLAEMPPG